QEFPRDSTLQELFEAQVQRTPDASAVTSSRTGITYAELNGRANQLAHYLRELGVGPETRVGVLLDRSIEMVVGLLAILKAGGAYLPLDPLYPKNRLEFMLGDAKASVLLTEEKLAGLLSDESRRTVLLDAEAAAIGRKSRENPISIAVPENLAY